MAEKENQERRYKVLFIEKALMLAMVSGLYKNNNLALPDFGTTIPEDAIVVDVRYFFEYDAFGFKIFSKTYDIVPVGFCLPNIENTEFTIRHIDLKKTLKDMVDNQ